MAMQTNDSPEFLISEARELYEQAKKYREEMESLPADDPRRETYERIIRDLLDRSKKMSRKVKSFVEKS